MAFVHAKFWANRSILNFFDFFDFFYDVINLPTPQNLIFSIFEFFLHPWAAILNFYTLYNVSAEMSSPFWIDFEISTMDHAPHQYILSTVAGTLNIRLVLFGPECRSSSITRVSIFIIQDNNDFFKFSNILKTN